MKKICSIFLICTIMLTGFSMPTFADKMPSIKNLTDEKVSLLETSVNDVFYNIINRVEDYSDSRGVLFDAMCYSDLIVRYYMSFKFKERAREYLAKMYVIKGEMMWCSFDKTLVPIQLDIYFLRQAAFVISFNKNSNLCSEINKMLTDFEKNAVEFIKADNFCSKLSKKEIEDKLYEGIPNNKKEAGILIDITRNVYCNWDNILYYSDIIIDENDELFKSESGECDSKSSNEKFLNPDKGMCSLRFDPLNKYSIRNVINNVLKGNYLFGEDNTHIALGYFKIG